MSLKLYVGNLTYAVTDAMLSNMFAAYGEVKSAQIIMDRVSGQSKGFGFVEMADDNDAKAAINALNGQEVEGRSLTVNEAKPRESSGSSGGPRRPMGGGGSSSSRRY
jgi:cold-inducible RNA-binding protein